MRKSGAAVRGDVDAGGDLKEALGNDPFGEFGWHRKGGRVLMDVARGLHFLHMHQVAHR